MTVRHRSLKGGAWRATSGPQSDQGKAAGGVPRNAYVADRYKRPTSGCFLSSDLSKPRQQTRLGVGTKRAVGLNAGLQLSRGETVPQGTALNRPLTGQLLTARRAEGRGEGFSSLPEPSKTEFQRRTARAPAPPPRPERRGFRRGDFSMTASDTNLAAIAKRDRSS